MAGKKNKPEIRFKGFSDEWEERELGDFCMLGDIDHKMPQSVNDGIPYLMTGDFIGINELDFENSKRISTEDYEQLSKKIKPEAGDILFARYASVGAVRYVETQMKFLISYSCAIIKHNNIANGKYLFYYLQANEAQRKIELEINTGSQRNIGIDSLKKLIILLPQHREQDEIAAFFNYLDTLITLHQSKYDKLVTVKKAMLEKMFPQNGAVAPAIRFKGFTEDWEEKELSQVVDLRSGRDYKHLTEGHIPVYGTGGYMLSVNDALSYDEDAIGIGRKGTIDKPYILKAPFWTVDTLFYAVPKGKNDLYFIYDVFQKINWKQKDESTGVPSLSKVAINGIQIFITKCDEQIQIGNYFKHLDHLITLQQRELEKLKNIKKACLEKMFV